MKKIMQSLLVLLLALSLVACSNTTEVEPTPTPTTTSESEDIDTNVYVPIGTKELNLDELVLPLDDYTYDSIEINKDKSNYDLNTKGEYELILDLKDENGEVTEEVNTTLIVDEKEIVEEKVEAQKEQKKRNEKVETPDEELVAKPSNDGKTTTTQNPQKSETNKTQSNNTSSNNNSSSNNTSSNSGSSSDWNGGLNTDPTVYGLDPNNEYVIAAMDLLGKEGKCDLIAAELYNNAGHTDNSNTYKFNSWTDLSSCGLEIGDWIYYHGLNGNNSVEHMAVYLGNGLAFQGNWTGGVARIASAEQGATRGYTVISRYEKDCTTCESCGFGSNPTSDEEWQAQVDAFDTNVCELYKDNIDVAAAEGKITMDEYLMCIANGY